MKFYPRSNSFFEDAFDDMFRSPFFTSSNDMCMKTDITEKDGNYLLDMELPGCRKEDIHLELNDGYLNISAARKEISFVRNVTVAVSHVVSMLEKTLKKKISAQAMTMEN